MLLYLPLHSETHASGGPSQLPVLPRKRSFSLQSSAWSPFIGYISCPLCWLVQLKRVWWTAVILHIALLGLMSAELRLSPILLLHSQGFEYNIKLPPSPKRLHFPYPVHNLKLEAV